LKRKIWPLLLLVGILLVAGGAFLYQKVTILHIDNMDRQRATQIRIKSSDTFSMSYIHSIYREPVIEEFQAEEDAIVLKGIRTKSPAVMEYYGFGDMKEFHPMNVRMGAVFIIRRGMGQGQGLILGDRKIYLSEIGERGDRIQLRVESMPLLKYLFSEIFK